MFRYVPQNSEMPYSDGYGLKISEPVTIGSWLPHSDGSPQPEVNDIFGFQQLSNTDYKPEQVQFYENLHSGYSKAGYYDASIDDDDAFPVFPPCETSVEDEYISSNRESAMLQSNGFSMEDEFISCDFTQPLMSVGNARHDYDKRQQIQSEPMVVDLTEDIHDSSYSENLIIDVDEADQDIDDTLPRVLPVIASPKSADKQNGSSSESGDSNLPTDSVNSKISTRTKRRKLALKPAVVSEWLCVPCNRMFRVERGLKQHNRSCHSGARPFICNICGKRYHDQETMLRHQRNHVNENKAFKCEKCNRQYIYIQDLKRHMSFHHEEARHKCKYCGKTFSRDDHARHHETSHENGTVKRFPRKSKIQN